MQIKKDTPPSRKEYLYEKSLNNYTIKKYF